MVAFIAAGRKLEVKNWLTELSTSRPRRDQADLKKHEVKPSGPGALLVFSFLGTLVISSAGEV